jgi:hypothetical protein
MGRCSRHLGVSLGPRQNNNLQQYGDPLLELKLGPASLQKQWCPRFELRKLMAIALLKALAERRGCSPELKLRDRPPILRRRLLLEGQWT